MYKIFAVTSLILLLVSSIIYCGVINNRKYECRILRRNNNSRLILIAEFRNNDRLPAEISYQFRTVKIGGSGNSSNSQSGTKKVKGNSEEELSKVIFNYSKSDNYKAYLQVFKDNAVISSDSIVINETR